MGKCMFRSTSETRASIKIVYSSTTGTSKKVASRLQEILQDNKYSVQVINIGDINTNELLIQNEIVIFMLSTYQNGDSPSDGDIFLKWIQNLKPEQTFVNLNYCILAFGNSTFPIHCGFGVRTEKVIKSHGGKELLQLTKCDSASSDKNVDSLFPEWSKRLTQVLSSKFQIKSCLKTENNIPYTITLQNLPNFNWQYQAKNCENLSKQFKNYLKMHKCKVIHVKQIRKQVGDDRSTLWVRLQINKNINLTPACNIDVFPLNLIQAESNDNLIVTFSQRRGKIPFPPMNLGELTKRVNYTQNATTKQIKLAIRLATASEQKIQQYYQILQQKPEMKIQCKKLVQDLKPKIQFLAELGLNCIRTSTLASWDPELRYLDLCVSTVKNGLASNFYKSRPEYISINPIKSMFAIPENRPIVMIANGSGMAPFRSIAQYCDSLPIAKRNFLRLYLGIQSQNVDFYFEEEWRQLQKKSIVELRIAESKKQGKVKQYVQDVLEQDVQWLCQHLYFRNGVIFICGGLSMSKSVTDIIVKSLILQQKTLEKAQAMLSQMKETKTIVEQVYG